MHVRSDSGRGERQPQTSLYIRLGKVLKQQMLSVREGKVRRSTPAFSFLPAPFRILLTHFDFSNYSPVISALYRWAPVSHFHDVSFMPVWPLRRMYSVQYYTFLRWHNLTSAPSAFPTPSSHFRMTPRDRKGLTRRCKYNTAIDSPDVCSPPSAKRSSACVRA